MLKERMAIRTKGMWSDLRTQKERQTVFASLSPDGLLKAKPKRGKTEPHVPLITCRRHIFDVLPVPSTLSSVLGLLECVDVSATDQGVKSATGSR